MRIRNVKKKEQKAIRVGRMSILSTRRELIWTWRLKNKCLTPRMLQNSPPAVVPSAEQLKKSQGESGLGSLGQSGTTAITLAVQTPDHHMGGIELNFASVHLTPSALALASQPER